MSLLGAKPEPCPHCNGSGLVTCAQEGHRGCVSKHVEVELEPATEFFPSMKGLTEQFSGVNHVCLTCNGKGFISCQSSA